MGLSSTWRPCSSYTRSPRECRARRGQRLLESDIGGLTKSRGRYSAGPGALAIPRALDREPRRCVWRGPARFPGAQVAARRGRRRGREESPPRSDRAGSGRPGQWPSVHGTMHHPAGNRTRNTLPAPTVDSTHICPPWVSTMRLWLLTTFPPGCLTSMPPGGAGLRDGLVSAGALRS